MRIIHSSDWHIGQNFMNKSRESEHRAFLNFLLTNLINLGVDALVVAGDIFDTGTPPSYARNLYFDFLKEAKEKWGGQIVIVGGNHDSVATLSESEALLQLANTIVVGGAKDDPTEEVFVLNKLSGEPGAVICAVPFLRDRDVRKSQAGEDATAKSEALRQGISKHYSDVYEVAREKDKELGGNLPLIATAHLTTQGGTLTEGVRELYIGTLQGYASEDFPADFDYIALGHLHKKQIMGQRDHIRYCGSPIPLSFIEAEYERTVNLVDFAADKSITVEEIVVPVTQELQTLRGNIMKITESLQNLLMESGDKSVWLEIEVEVDESQGAVSKEFNAIVEGSNIEILRIKRRQKNKKNQPSQLKAVQLHEMTVEEVFQKRLSEAELDSEKSDQLAMAFKELHAELLEENS